MKFHRGAGATDRGFRSWPLTVALGWSVVVSAFGVLWTAGIMRSPLGKGDRRFGEVGSLFDGLTSSQTGLVAVGVGLAGVGVALSMVTRPASRWPGIAALCLAVVLVGVIPDIRMIQNFAYLFIAYTGLWEGGLAALLVAMLGGCVWGVAAVAFLRPKMDLLPRAAPRWSVPMTYAAAALALPYPVVRIAWGLGIPLGVPADYGILHESIGVRLAVVLLLGGLPVAGAVLTIGLVRRWGEVFPAWLPWLGGRRVPIWFAVVPGLWAAALICQAGLRTAGWAISDLGQLSSESWGEGLPGLFYLPWGVVLAAAVYAYAVRRLGVRATEAPAVESLRP